MLTGSRTVYRYNQDKLILSIEYDDGSREEYVYDECQNKTVIRDRRGNELRRRYDGHSRVVEEILPNGLTTEYAYDSEGNLVRRWDNAGRSVDYVYRSGALCETRERIEGGKESIWRFGHDAMGRMTAMISPNGGRWSYAYKGGCSEPNTFTTPEGAVFRYAYDEAGRRMSISGDQGEVRFAYNNLDYRTQVTDALGNITKYFFDMLCNLTKVVLPNQYNERSGDGDGTRYVYDDMDGQILRIDPLGNVLATPRDAAGNVIKEINPNSYDPAVKNGEGIENEYDAFDRKIRIRYPDGGVERIFYDAAGNIVKKVSPENYNAETDDGPGYTYLYDEVNRLTQITAPDGTVEKRYVYDLCGRIVKLIGAEGFLAGEDDESRVGTLYAYNAASWLTEKREPVDRGEDGSVRYRLTAYRYDAAGNVMEERRYQELQREDGASGPVLSIYFAYDRCDRLIRVTDSTGAALQYAYDSSNRRTLEKRKLGEDLYQTLRWNYDAAGRLTEQTQSFDRPDGGCGFAVTRYTYDKTGNLTRIQLPAGGEIRREYDPADRLTAETHIDRAGGIRNRTELRYDKAGNLVEITDNLGRKTRIEYDLLNREIRRTERDGGVTRSFYDVVGHLQKRVRPNQYDGNADDGAGYQYIYDHHGRVLSVVGPDGAVLQTNVYDRDGRLLQQRDASGSGAAFRYDFAGNRVRIETAGGASQEFLYDAFGNITGVVDGNGNRTTYHLDAWGRVVGVKKADGSSEYYAYDFAGNMVSSTDGEGNLTRYRYGRMGQLAAVIDPEGNEERYVYDGEGRLIQKTDRRGVVTEMAYNMYDAPLSRRVKGGEWGESYEYTPERHLKCAFAGGMRYAYEYDEMGRLARKSASGRTLLAFTYDGNGNRLTQTDVTGKTTRFAYSLLDQPVKMWDNDRELAAFGYNPDGTLKLAEHGPLRREYAYDADKNLTFLRVQSAGETLVENRYGYDGNGNRTEKRGLGGDTFYGYDGQNRLVRAEYPGCTEELYYDRAGNRTRRVAGNVEETYRYDSRNRLTERVRNGVATVYDYDAAGNLVADDRARYSYDGFNRAVSVEGFDGSVQINRYDAEGLRHEIEENGRLVRFIFNPEREAVTEESGDSVNRLIRATELIAATSDADSARTYYHYASDEMGSITHIVDKAGAVRNRYEYDAWGNITAQEETVPNRFKFTGQQFDPVAQQYYLRARFYNPVIARFTQEDTYRGDGLNLYAYCANNPTFYRDPTGNTSQCMKDAYLEAKRAGATKEEAYAAAKAAYEKNHTDTDPRPQVDVPADRSMSREEWDKAYKDARVIAGASDKIEVALQNQQLASEVAAQVNRRPKDNKTVATDGTIYTLSGWSALGDDSQFTRVAPAEVMKRADNIGYLIENNYRDHGVDKQFNACHAEKQLSEVRLQQFENNLSLETNQPIGISRKMCDDCEGYFKALASSDRPSPDRPSLGRQQRVVADPYFVRIFNQDGSVTVIER